METAPPFESDQIVFGGPGASAQDQRVARDLLGHPDGIELVDASQVDDQSDRREVVGRALGHVLGAEGALVSVTWLATDDASTAVVVCVTLPVQWRMRDAFPSSGFGQRGSFGFDGPHLIAASHDLPASDRLPDPVQRYGTTAGLNFVATADLGRWRSAIGGVAELLGVPSVVSVTGVVHDPSTQARIHWRIPVLSNDPSLGGVALPPGASGKGAITFPAVVVGFDLDSGTGAFDQIADVWFGLRKSVGDGSRTAVFKVGTADLQGSYEFELSFEDDQGGAATLTAADALAAIFGADNLPTETGPFELLGPVGLRGARFTVDRTPTSASIVFIVIDVGLGDAMQLFDGLELTDAGATIAIWHPANSPSTFVTVYASLLIGQSLRFNVRYEDGSLSGHLFPTQPISLLGTLQDLGIGLSDEVVESLPDVALHELSLGLETANESWFMEAVLSADVRLFGRDLLQVHRSVIGISHDGSKNPVVKTLTISGDLSAFKTETSLELTVESGPTGRADGQVGFRNVRLGNVAEWLYQLARPNETLVLSPPWDLLLTDLFDLNLGTFDVDFDLATKTVGVTYQLPPDESTSPATPGRIRIAPDFVPIEMSITGFSLTYQRAGKYRDGGSTKVRPRSAVQFNLVGDFPETEFEFGDGEGLSTTDDGQKQMGWDLVNGNPPAVPSAAPAYFALHHLGMGQRIGFRDPTQFNRIADVMRALQEQFALPPSAGTNPLAAANGLVYSQDSSWLIGVSLEVAKAVRLDAIWNDPDLYGLRLGLSGPLAKGFAGLEFDILYKRITDELGQFHVELVLPDQFRRFDIGAASITLPIIVVDIFTNGNFKVDFGFPHGGDFSRSASAQMLPFVGYGGFYFGLLNGQTSSRVPATSVGDFRTVIEAGLGLSVGVGKTIQKGPLKAGATLTLEVVVEGVLAWFHPDDPTEDVEMYFRLEGLARLIGRLYGEIDFKVIAIEFSVTAYAQIALTVEAHEPTQVDMAVGVEVKASVTVVLVKVSFSFRASISHSFRIGERTDAPWRGTPSSLRSGATTDGAAAEAAPQARTAAAASMMFEAAPLAEAVPVAEAVAVAEPVAAREAAVAENAVPVRPAVTPKRGNEAMTPVQRSLAAASGDSTAMVTRDASFESATTSTTTSGTLSSTTVADVADLPTPTAPTVVPVMITPLFTREPPGVDDTADPPTTVLSPRVVVALSIRTGPGLGQPSVTESADQRPFQRLAAELLRHHIGKVTATRTMLMKLAEDLEDPDPPQLELPALTRFLTDRKIALQIVKRPARSSASSSAQPIDTALFPMPPIVRITVGGRTVDLGQGTIVPDTYLAEVRRRRRSTQVQIGDEADQDATGSAGTTTLPEVVFRDWFGIVLRALVDACIDELDDWELTVFGDIAAGKAAVSPPISDILRTLRADGPGAGLAFMVVNRARTDLFVAQTLTKLVVDGAELADLTVTATASFDQLAADAGVTLEQLADSDLLRRGGLLRVGATVTVPDRATADTEELIGRVVSGRGAIGAAGIASRALLGGTRLPDPTEPTGEPTGLYDKLGQEFALEPDLTKAVVVTVDVPSAGSNPPTVPAWLRFDGSNPSARIRLTTEERRLANQLAGAQLDPITSLERLPSIVWSPARFALERSAPWELGNGTVHTLLPFPDGLQRRLDELGDDATTAFELVLGHVPRRATAVQWSNPASHSWATWVDLRTRLIPHAGTALTTSHLLLGADADGAERLHALRLHLQGDGESALPDIELLVPSSGDRRTWRSVALDRANSGVLKTNPETADTGDDEPTWATFQTEGTGPVELFRLLWESTMSPNGGFVLRVVDGDGDGLPADLFRDGPDARVRLLVTLPSSRSGGSTRPQLRPFHNAVVVESLVNSGTDHPAVQARSVLVAPGQTATAIARALGVPARKLTKRDVARSPGTALSPLPGDRVAPAPGLLQPVAALPAGTVGLRLLRDDPTDSQSADDLIDAVFNLLSTRFAGSSHFDGPLLAAPLRPISPIVHRPDDEPTERATAADGRWRYEQVVEPFRSMKETAQIATGRGLPSASNDPYAGVAAGATLRVEPRWGDLFGNVAPADATSQRLSVPVRYTDLLRPVASWPGCVISWYVEDADDEGRPVLRLHLDFDMQSLVWGKKGQPPIDSDARLEQERQLSQIWFQHRSADIAFRLETTLGASSATPVTHTLPAESFTDLLKGALVFHRQIAGDGVAPALVDDLLTAVDPPTVPSGGRKIHAFASSQHVDPAMLLLVNAPRSIMDVAAVRAALQLGATDDVATLLDAHDARTTSLGLDEPLTSTVALLVEHDIALRGDVTVHLPVPTFHIAVTLSHDVPSPLFPIEVGVMVERTDTTLLDPTVADVAAAAVSRSVVPPNLNLGPSSNGSGGIHEFARLFEEAFRTSSAGGGRYEGVKLLTGKEPGTSTTLWGMRLSNDTSIPAAKRYWYDVQKAIPAYLAVAPLATRLLAFDAPIATYAALGDDPSAASSIAYAAASQVGVDLDSWARLFLRTVDLVLTPEYAMGAYLADRRAFDRLVVAKQRLATAVAARLAPILVPTTGEATPDLATASAALERRLLVRLERAFDIDTLLQVNVTATGPPTGASSPPRLLGAMRNVAVVPEADDTIADVAARLQISPSYLLGLLADSGDLFADGSATAGTSSAFATGVRLPITAVEYAKPATADIGTIAGFFGLSETDLEAMTGSTADELAAPGVRVIRGVDLLPAFTLSSVEIELDPESAGGVTMTSFLDVAREGRDPKMFLDLDYVITGVRHRIEAVAGIPGAERSSVLQFVHPLDEARTEATADIGQIEVPLPLRDAPEAPIVIGHQAVSEPPEDELLPDDVAGWIASFDDWTYRVEYGHQLVAQDDVYLHVEFGNDADSLSELQSSDHDGAAMADADSDHPVAAASGDDDTAPPSTLSEWLAQFAAVFPELDVDLAALPAAASSSTPTDHARGIRVLSWLADKVADSWALWVRPAPAPAATVAGHELHEYRLETVLDASEAAWLDEMTVTAGSTSSGTGFVEAVNGDAIFPTELNAGVVRQVGGLDVAGLEALKLVRSDAVSVAFQYGAPGPPDSDGNREMVYSDFGPISTPPQPGEQRSMRVGFGDLGVLERSSARSGLRITRNADLISGRTVAPEFVYQSALVETSGPVQPFVRHLAPVVLAGHPSVADALGALFSALLSKVAGRPREMAVRAMYCYEPIPGGSLFTKVPVLNRTRFTFVAGVDDDPTDPAGFVSEIDVALREWARDAAPLAAAATWSIHLVVYDLGDEDDMKRPVMELADVRIPIVDPPATSG